MISQVFFQDKNKNTGEYLPVFTNYCQMLVQMKNAQELGYKQVPKMAQ